MWSQEVYEADRAMSLGLQNSFSIIINEGDIMTVRKQWEKFVRQYAGKTRYLTYSDEFFTDNAKITPISSNPVDVYMHAYDRGGGIIEVQTWFFLGGVYLQSKMHPAGAEYARQIMREFLQSYSRAIIAVVIDKTQEQLQAEEREFARIQKDRRELEARITKLESELLAAKQQLKVLDDQADAETLIQQRNDQLQQLKAQKELTRE